MSAKPPNRIAGPKSRTEKKKIEKRKTDPYQPKWDLNFMQQYADQLMKHPCLLPNYKPPPDASDYKVLKERALARQAVADALCVNASHYGFMCRYRHWLNKAISKAKLDDMSQPFEMDEILKHAPPLIRKLEKHFNLLPDILNKYQETASHRKKQPDFLRALVIKMSIARHCGTSEIDATTCVAQALGQSFQVVSNVWTKQCKVSMEKLRHLQSAGDAMAATPRPARLQAVDWITVDVLLMHHNEYRLITQESLRDFSQRSTLTTLFSIVQSFSLDGGDGDRRLWITALEDYLARGLCSSLVVLQRRWYELVAEARARLAAALRDQGELQLPPLLKVIATRCRYLMTSPQPSWEDLVRNGKIYYQTADEHFALEQKLLEGKLPDTTNTMECQAQQGDDLILIEKEIETIELDSDEERLAASTANLLRSSVEEQNTPKANQSTSEIPSIRSSMSEDEPLSSFKSRYDTLPDKHDRNDDQSSDDDDNLHIDEDHLEANTNTLTEVTATNTTASKTNIDSLSLFNQLNPTECETEVMFSDEDDDSPNDFNIFNLNVDINKKTDVGNDLTESDKNFNVGNAADSQVRNIEGLKEGGTERNESLTENVINNENDDNNYKSNNTTVKTNIVEDITDSLNSEDNVNVSEWPKKGKPHSRNLKKVKERKERERLMSQGASGSSHGDFTFNESQNTKDNITNDRVTEIIDTGDGDSKTNEIERDGEPPIKRMKPHSRNMKKAKELRRQRELLQFNRNEENTSFTREINFEVDIDENMIGSDEGSIKIDDGDDSDDETVADDVKLEIQSNDSSDYEDSNFAEKLLLKAIVPLIRIDDNKIWRKHAVDNTIDLKKASNIADLGGRVVKRSRRRKPTNPDFDIRLKGLSEEFMKANKDLLKLCVPASVVVNRICDQRYKAIMLLSSMRTRRTKVSLPSIDEVRRINRSLLTAQVAPLSLAHTHKTESEIEEIASSSNNTNNIPDNTLTPENLDDLLGRLSNNRNAPSTSTRKPVHCCTARRHLAMNAARRRVAIRAGKVPPPFTDFHGSSHEKNCDCCCAAALREMPDDRILNDSIKNLNRSLKELKYYSHDENPNENASTKAQNPGPSEKQDGRPKNTLLVPTQEKTQNIEKDKNKSKSKKVKEKSKKDKTKDKEEEESETYINDYLEWQRQKSLHTKYFELKPNFVKKSKKSNKKQNIKNPTNDDQLTVSVVTPQNDGQIQKDRLVINLDVLQNDQDNNDQLPKNLAIDLTETNNYDTKDNMIIQLDTLNDQNTSEFTDKTNKNDQSTSKFTDKTNKNDQNTPEFTDKTNKNDQNTSEFTDKTNKNDQNTSEFTDKTNKNHQSTSEFTDKTIKKDQNTSEFTDKPNKNDQNTSEVDTERCKNEPPKPKLKLVPTSRLQSECQVKLNPVIENSSPATVGLQARMGLVATLNHENTHKYEDNELFSVSPLNEDSIQTLPYIVSNVSETNNQQCSSVQGPSNVLSMKHIQQDVLPVGQNLQNVLPAEQYTINLVPTVKNQPNVLPTVQNQQNIQKDVLPVGQNLQNVLPTEQFKLNVVPTVQNLPNVLPTVQNQQNKQQDVLSVGQNLQNVLPTEQFKLNLVPTVQNLPNVLSTVQNKPDVLPTAQNLPTVLSTGQSQLNMLPTVQNKPNVLPTVQNQQNIQQNVLPVGQNLPNLQHTAQHKQNVAPTAQNRPSVLATGQNQQKVPAQNRPNIIKRVRIQSPPNQYRLKVVNQTEVPQNLQQVLPEVQNVHKVLPVAEKDKNVLFLAQNASSTNQFRLKLVSKAGNETLNVLPTAQNPLKKSHDKIIHILPSGEAKVLYRVPQPKNVQPNTGHSETKVLHKEPPTQNVLSAVPLQPTVQPNTVQSGTNVLHKELSKQNALSIVPVPNQSTVQPNTVQSETNVLHKEQPTHSGISIVPIPNQSTVQPNTIPSENNGLYKGPPTQNVLSTVQFQQNFQPNIISLKDGQIHLVPAVVQPGQQVNMITTDGLIVPQLVSLVENNSQAILVPFEGHTPVSVQENQESKKDNNIPKILETNMPRLKALLTDKKHTPKDIQITITHVPNKELNEITEKDAFRPSESLMSQIVIANDNDEFHKVCRTAPKENEHAKYCVIKYKKDSDVDPKNRVTKTKIKLKNSIIFADNDDNDDIFEVLDDGADEQGDKPEQAIEISDESNDGGSKDDENVKNDFMPIISKVTSLCNEVKADGNKHVPLSFNIQLITQNKGITNENFATTSGINQSKNQNDVTVPKSDGNESNNATNMPNESQSNTNTETNAEKFANAIKMLAKLNKVTNQFLNECQNANEFEPVISNVASLASESNQELATRKQDPVNTVANSMPFTVTSEGPTPVIVLEYDASELQPPPNPNTLSNEPPIRASDYIIGRDPTNIQILCVDSKLPILRILDSFLVTTSRRLITDDPTFWTISPNFGSRQLILSGNSSEKQKGVNNPFSTTKGRVLPMPTTIQSDGGDVLTAPEELWVNHKTFRKLNDIPLVYAEVWTVISKIELVQSLARNQAPLSLYCQRSGRLIPVENKAENGTIGLSVQKAKDALKVLIALLNGDQPPTLSNDVIDLDSD